MVAALAYGADVDPERKHEMPSITFRALCQFRDEQADMFARHVRTMKVAKKNSPSLFVAIDKALNAARDCNQAHGMICTLMGSFSDNPCPVWSAETIALIRSSIGDKAEQAYAHYESECETLDARNFERNAYGD